MQSHSPGQRTSGLPRPATMPTMKGKVCPHIWSLHLCQFNVQCCKYIMNSQSFNNMTTLTKYKARKLDRFLVVTSPLLYKTVIFGFTRILRMFLCLQADPGKASAAQNSSETVLANFFNSLLNKNTTGKPGVPGAKAANPAGGGANRSDVQAELERMSKKSAKKEEKWG